VYTSTCLSPCPYVTSYLAFHQANYTWHRHACGSISPGPPNYNMNFSSSCVTPEDNSTTRAVKVDSYILTKPSKAQCPNRYVTALVADPCDNPEDSQKRTLQAEIPIDIGLSDRTISEVDFVTAEFSGESYRRLIEPMTEFIPMETTCASSQVEM
jgi:hypothetical protein